MVVASACACTCVSRHDAGEELLGHEPADFGGVDEVGVIERRADPPAAAGRQPRPRHHRKKEVHGYVNKEMLLLAVIGIAIGLPCGRGLLGFLLGQLNLPGMNIVPHVAWCCYALAALLALLFTVIVEKATNKSLDSIDMVGALKSPG
ncbi:hypothetical protein EHS19_01445 [Bifidobacterium jacchi]|uniref:Uncharacterized protein n=1 Tax=Bifidobacterium jacchi TaxID=2490545 RepID=A0A5N5RNI0_9BIFI|nr:hypothetical protein EHS19_01445 [Bifidobacterium jacchi]